MSFNTIEDVSCSDTWKRLAADADAVLIDVRTQAEWAFVGLPDLSSVGKQPILVEWQRFPDSRVDPRFVEAVSAKLSELGVGKNADMFFLCRSGGRSRMAADAMMSAGFTRCHNVAEGFEGPLDGERHRGQKSGWKAAGLPWAQG